MTPAHWQLLPVWSFGLAHEVAKAVGSAAGDPELYEKVTKSIAQAVLDRVIRQRQKRFDGEAVKTDMAYLNHVMIKAGFYDLMANPEGGTLKQRWSIAFVNMDQGAFDRIYKGVAGVIWNETLAQHFDNEYEMEQAVNQLLEY